MLPVEDGGGGDAVWGWSRALDSHKGRSWVDINVSRPRALDSCGGLARGPFFCGRIPDFSSGIRGLRIDSSALGRGGRRKWTKMSDTKVKVAVRVRPMNRRGKFDHLHRLHISHIAHLFQRSPKVGTSSPLLLAARIYEPAVRLDPSLKKVPPFLL